MSISINKYGPVVATADPYYTYISFYSALHPSYGRKCVKIHLCVLELSLKIASGKLTEMEFTWS